MRRHRPAREVVAAWLLTGPLGHLWAGLADCVALAFSLARARARRERP